MRLHNFLVDYRESKLPKQIIDEIVEDQLFHEELADTGICPIVVGNDTNRGIGNITNDKRQ